MSEPTLIAGLKVHPFANLFPMMTETELAGLVDDIRANDLEQRITIYKGTILDGRNRALAIDRLGRLIFAYTHEFNGSDAEALKFVVSRNLHRRHLDESQRAMIAARLANLQDGQRASASPIGEGAAVTQQQAAELLNVGKRSVERARAVIEHGTPELVAAVERGEVSVSKAAGQARARLEEGAATLAKTSSMLKRARDELDPVSRADEGWRPILLSLATLVRQMNEHDENLPPPPSRIKKEMLDAWGVASLFMYRNFGVRP